MDIFALFNALPGAVAQGLIWGIMAIGLYITYKVLDVADDLHDAGKAIDNATDAIDGTIDTYKALKKADSSIGKEVHHIVEKRLAPALKIDKKNTRA